MKVNDIIEQYCQQQAIRRKEIFEMQILIFLHDHPNVNISQLKVKTNREGYVVGWVVNGVEVEE